MAEKSYLISSAKSVRGDPEFSNGLISGELTNITADKLEGLTKIGSYKFYNDPGIQYLEIPNTVEYIGEGSISSLNINSLTIPSSVKYLGNNAISSIGQLNTLTIESDDFDYVGFGCFKYLNSSLYHTENGLTYLPTENNPYFCITDITPSYNFGDLIISNKVKAISAMINSEPNLTSFDFEEGSKIASLPNDLLYMCDNLKHVGIPENVEHCTTFVSYCYALESIDFRCQKPIKSSGQRRKHWLGINEFEKN